MPHGGTPFVGRGLRATRCSVEPLELVGRHAHERTAFLQAGVLVLPVPRTIKVSARASCRSRGAELQIFVCVCVVGGAGLGTVCPQVDALKSAVTVPRRRSSPAGSEDSLLRGRDGEAEKRCLKAISLALMLGRLSGG
jgi:hypothetical protein